MRFTQYHTFLLFMPVILLVGCSTQSQNVSKAPTYRNIQVVIQGSIIAEDSLTTSLDRGMTDTVAPVISDIASRSSNPAIAIAGIIADNVINNNIRDNDVSRVRAALQETGSEIEPTIAGYVADEMNRQISCDVIESGYRQSSMTSLERGPLPNSRFSFRSEESKYGNDVKSLLKYLSDNLDLYQTWNLDQKTDALLFVQYRMIFKDDTVRDFIDELQGELAEVAWYLAPLSEPDSALLGDVITLTRDSLIGNGAVYQVGLKEFVDNAVLGARWPVLNYEPSPPCSAKSFVEANVASYFTASSTGDDIENFFKDLDISFKHDQGYNRYISSYQTNTNRNTVSSEAELIIYYKPGTKRLFDRAVIR